VAQGILTLAVPTTMQSLLQAAAVLVETVVAARLGREALAGYAVVLPFTLLLGQMSAGAMGGGVVSDGVPVGFDLAISTIGGLIRAASRALACAWPTAPPTMLACVAKSRRWKR
jgi:hypothetical protein